MLTDHERRISHLEGKLDSLATKELVFQLHAELLKEMRRLFDQVNAKIDQQTAELRAELNGQTSELRGELNGQTSELRGDIKALDQRINDQDRKYTKLAGAAVAIGLILSLLIGAANVFVAAVNAGLLTVS